MLYEDILGGTGATLHAINDDYIRTGSDSQFDVIESPSCSELDIDGLLPVRGLAEFTDLDRQVIRSCPVRVARSRTLVNAGREGSHRGDAFTNFLSEQHASSTRFCPLAYHDLDCIGLLQMLWVKSVARR